MKFFAFIFALVISSQVIACDDWFKSLKIKDFKSCNSKCRTSQTDMSSYMCPNDCDNLCKTLNTEKSQNVNLYGMTDAERDFCEKNKVDCALAYKLSWEAESACLSIYKKSDTNDESDACRHYVWSFLLAQKFGEKKALKILDAHENNPEQDLLEKEMDDHNNKVALGDFKTSKSSEKSKEEILKLFKNKIQANKLKIINSKYLKSRGIP